jgi:phytanoyl-CoA hydroxylase
VQLSAEQVQQYREDGFLIVDNLLSTDEVGALIEAFDRIFAGDLALVVEPDEYKWQKGRDPEGVQRQIAGIWRSDPIAARQAFFGPHAAIAGQLEGVDGVRLWGDMAMWKPEGGTPFGMHQDAAYMCWLQPVQNFTCWIALDDTHADAGTLCYVPGSHRWGPTPASGATSLVTGESGAWLDHLSQFAPSGASVELVPVEVKAGGAAFHTGWVWHGSGPNTRPGTIRRSYSVHMFPVGSRHHPHIRHPAYSRYLTPGSLELPDSFFPVLWTADGGRSHWLEDFCQQMPVSAYAPEAVEAVRSVIAVEPWRGSRTPATAT